MRKLPILICFLCMLCLALYTPTLHAQTACEKALLEAENLYQSGQLYAISEKLLPCLEKGFSQQEKLSAYRLLALTYLNINQEENAKNAFYKLLQLNPDYTVSKEKDPVELYNLYQQFKVDPVFYTGLSIGAVLSLPQVLHQRTSSSLPGSDKFYKASYGFKLGADFVLPVHKKLLLEFNPVYTNSNYLFQALYLTDGAKEDAGSSLVQEVTGREQYQHIVLPLALNLRMPAKTAGLFYNLVMGAGPSFLLSSSFRDVNRVNRQIFSEEINLRSYETTPYRRMVNLQGQLEVGLEYKYAGYFWGARAGLSAMLLNFTQYENQQEMYLNPMSTTFGWLDDDFVLSSAYISLFVRKPIYKFL